MQFCRLYVLFYISFALLCSGVAVQCCAYFFGFFVHFNFLEMIVLELCEARARSWFLSSVFLLFFFGCSLACFDETNNDRVKQQCKINKTKADKSVSDKYLSHQTHNDFLIGFYLFAPFIRAQFMDFSNDILLSFIIGRRLIPFNSLLSAKKRFSFARETKIIQEIFQNLNNKSQSSTVLSQTHSPQFNIDKLPWSVSISFHSFKLTFQLFAVVIITFHQFVDFATTKTNGEEREKCSTQA